VGSAAAMASAIAAAESFPARNSAGTDAGLGRPVRMEHGPILVHFRCARQPAVPLDGFETVHGAGRGEEGIRVATT